ATRCHRANYRWNSIECEPLGGVKLSGAKRRHRVRVLAPKVGARRNRYREGMCCGCYGFKLAATTGGAVRAPLTTCWSGPDMRSARLKPVAGAGSQLLCLSAPGESC